MLDADREQAIGAQLEFLAIFAKRLDINGIGPFDVLIEAGYGQAAFLVCLNAVSFGDFWLIRQIGWSFSSEMSITIIRL